MRINAFRRGLMSILFVFALVFSLTFVATPVLAPDVISEPGGTIIEVLPGDNFTLRFRLQWDEPDAGYFAITLKWVCPENNPAENFTIVGVSAYFDNGQPISAAVTNETESPLGNGTLYIRVIGTPAGDPNNGPFNVDITILAGSEGFAHIPTDNHPIEIDGSILVAEAGPWLEYYPPDPVITIRVLARGVAVAISPSEDSGPPGATLRHTVSIKNLGSVEDTFTFEVASDADWSASIEPTSLTLTAGAMGEATLSVVVPPDADENASTTVVVKATSTRDPTVSNSSACGAVASGETPEAPSPTAWHAALVVLIAVIILVGGYALYSIFKVGQRKQKRKRTLRV